MPNHHTRRKYTATNPDRLVAAIDSLIAWRARTPRNPWAQRTAHRHEAKIRARLLLTAEDHTD